MAMPATVTTVPNTPATDRRSPRKIIPSGMANIGAVDDSTVVTATPACFTPTTNITELTAVRTDRHASVHCTLEPPARTRPAAGHAHGVAHSRRPPTGSRMA